MFCPLRRLNSASPEEQSCTHNTLISLSRDYAHHRRTQEQARLCRRFTGAGPAFYGRRIVGRTMILSRFAPSDYELRVEGQNLLVNGLSLHTLHIHSKALFAFTDTPLDIQRRIEKARRGSTLLRTSFIVSAFVFSMRTMVPIWLKSALSYSKWRQLLGRSRA